MPSIGGVVSGLSTLDKLNTQVQQSAPGGGNDLLGKTTQRFGQVLSNTLNGNLEGAMGQLGEITSTDPNAAYQDGALGKVGRGGFGFPGAGAGSVGDLVGTLNQAVGTRLATTEAAKEVAEQAQQTLVSGGDIDLHNVILASERAGLEMKLTMQLRNKLLEAYQEVMRTPV